ncbi:hypothetical protein BU26DRAFT_519863 [Trematosphaeria pertusa]|uniref:SHSP domain-containing protein n=1 Tax=Trematosphaeria pertusa TaxID=390896 RepID=A0A6A6ID46_9PLEO|nr:uncharacterized protein BU26DRAFT_519863 [Trematosphaeria pertusa]KAF2248127.1 hypothetical protein BU26DRAFT_519863 [Trematosphaeria pertusa]
MPCHSFHGHALARPFCHYPMRHFQHPYVFQHGACQPHYYDRPCYTQPFVEHNHHPGPCDCTFPYGPPAILRGAAAPQYAARDVQTSTPHFDVDESPSAYFVKSYIPGCHENDVSIRWADDQALEIEGVNAQGGGRGWRSVLNTGRLSEQGPADGATSGFTRRFQFPAQVQREGLRARVDDGVLQVMVPKAGEGSGGRGPEEWGGPGVGSKI